MHSINLGSCTYSIHPDFVVTHYPTGQAVGMREDTTENRQEAADQGYEPTAEGVRLSLREQELLHTLVARAMWCRESHVLTDLAGPERTRYALRLHEEALCISLARWLNTGEIDTVLDGHMGKLASVGLVARAMVADALRIAA